mgnify:CR=1 FL=1
MVQITSIESYVKVLESLGKRQMVVLKAIDKIEPCNNTQIANYLNLPINTVVPRVYELRKMGIVKLNKIDVCPTTKRRSMFWERVKK